MGAPVLVDGIRTPFLKAWTILDVPARDFAVVPIKALMERYPDLKKYVDYVIGANVGNQMLHPDGPNITRIIARHAGIPDIVGAWTVGINCATGLHAVWDAAKTVEVGVAKCVMVTAVEVMSDYPPMYSRKQRAAFFGWQAFLRQRKKQSLIRKIITAPEFLRRAAQLRFMPHKPLSLLDLGLTDPMTGLRMDQAADFLAKEWGVSREEQDRFALLSQQRAAAAQKSGRLGLEITPIGKFEHDNGIRHNQTHEHLERLKPQYKDGTVTAGNSSQLTDGATALIVADSDFAKAMGWPILAKLDAQHWGLAGCAPERFGIGPVLAIKQILERADMRLADFDLIETNEAFAAVVLAQQKALASRQYCSELGLGEPLGDLSFERTNVNGGAIAVGHPFAASGARLILTCAKELELKQKTLGLVTLCIGGGQGEALVLERV